MESYGYKKALFSFTVTDDDRNNNNNNINSTTQNSPPRLSTRSHQEMSEVQERVMFSPRRHSSAAASMVTLLPSPSPPESPWTLSPLRTSTSSNSNHNNNITPSPSILYSCVASLHRHEGNIYSIALAKGGVVFTGSNSNRIRAWRQPDCLERGHISASHGEVRAILAQGNTLFTAHKDFKIRVWNFTTLNSDIFRTRKIATLPKRRRIIYYPFRKLSSSNSHRQHTDCVSCMAYYHADGLLYTGSFDRKVKAWRVLDKRCVDSFVAHDSHVNAIVVNQDDGYVFTCSSDGSVKIWRRVYKENSHSLTMTLKLFQQSPVNALALSSFFNNSFLYSGSSDGIINFWEKEKSSGRYNHGGFLQAHRFAVLCLVASEKLMFSGSEDTTIRVWRREEGGCYHECLAVLDGHKGPVRCLAARLEIDKIVKGFLVYSASLDQTFKVWRVKVMPEEKSSTISFDYNHSDQLYHHGDVQTAKMEYEMSPVLSPSWVEKKIKGSDYF